MAPVYDFHERLHMSQGVARNKGIADILLVAIPQAIAVQESSLAEDRAGIDWWVTLRNGQRLGIDVKVRSEDYAARGEDDLALETLSVVQPRKIGWTLDTAKRSDRILWWWQDTGRWCLLPFPELREVFSVHEHLWADEYRRRITRSKINNETYHSEYIFVPRKVVWRAIYNQFGGDPKTISSRRTA